MREHSGTSHNSFYSSHRSDTGFQLHATGVKNLFRQYQESLTACLATLAVGGVFLGGMYLFLIQLADYGW